MQGHAFLGKYQQSPQPYVFGFRGRMDERYDLVRCVTDGRFVYIRNFRPDKIYGQHLDYMWQTPTTAIWERLFQQGQTQRMLNRPSGRPSRPKSCTTLRPIATK